MKRIVRIQTSALTSLNLPDASFTTVYEISPRLRPVAMLKVSGVASMVINAGKASLKSFQFTSAKDCDIKTPTKIRAGAVAYAGIAVASGEQNIARRNSPATAMLLKPVRAPAATPAALSI